MLHNSFGVQLSYASVDRGDGSDPRGAAREVLSRLRVLAAVRDATATWDLQDAGDLAIALTDDGRVLTLSAQDAIETSMTAAALREAFADAGLNLWIDADDAPLDDGFEEFEAEFDGTTAVEADEEDDEDEVDIDLSSFDPVPVRVAAFSHRGPAVARLLAEANRTPVDHLESGVWSLQRFRTAEPTAGWVSSKAELPVIEVNRTDDGGGWIEVTAGSGAVPFWPDAERDTQPVLDLDAITVAETAEVYRRLLTEGDGTRDELVGIAAHTRVDVDAAHRALIAESLGGVIGEEQRRDAFLAAFGIPQDLIESAFDETDPGARRFEPAGWWRAVGETLVAGVGEMAPLTRRNTPWQRLAGAVRRRPVLGLVIGVGEFVLGLWAARRFRGVARGLGILAMLDALGDAAVVITRLRRRR
ncbi:hypothetical protein [Microbacterium sp. CIAB417]|uniref:hypothetical protein n=1 Tax=Microbacterium sp. CIAB417 TaxID=2860287 RepID=UPI001FAB609F|nr:hypothetical protein [Microbacterium sp. CIAB417]